MEVNELEEMQQRLIKVFHISADRVINNNYSGESVPLYANAVAESAKAIIEIEKEIKFRNN